MARMAVVTTRTWRLLALAAALLVPAGQAAAQQQEQLTQFDRWWNAVWGIGLFLALLALLRVLAWKPLLRVIQDREEGIRSALRDADQRRQESEALLMEYRAQLDTAQDEVQRMMARSTRAAETARQKIIEDAQRTAGLTTEQGRQEIERARRQALDEMYRTTADLAADMAGRIIGREINPDDHRRLLDQSVEALRKQE